MSFQRVLFAAETLAMLVAWFIAFRGWRPRRMEKALRKARDG